MATKLKKYPKKPKASATVQTMQNYLAKVKEVDRANAAIKAEAKKKVALRKQIAGVGRAK